MLEGKLPCTQQLVDDPEITHAQSLLTLRSLTFADCCCKGQLKGVEDAQRMERQKDSNDIKVKRS